MARLVSSRVGLLPTPRWPASRFPFPLADHGAWCCLAQEARAESFGSTVENNLPALDQKGPPPSTFGISPSLLLERISPLPVLLSLPARCSATGNNEI